MTPGPSIRDRQKTTPNPTYHIIAYLSFITVTMKICCVSFLLLPLVAAFSTPQVAVRSTTYLQSTASNEDSSLFSRRELFSNAIATSVGVVGASTLLSIPTEVANAEGSAVQNVVVAGATGQTGSRIYSRLMSNGFTATGGVRNVQKAKLPGTIKHLDVVEDSVSDLTETLKGADGLIIACGMNPGKNLFRMSEAAHEVDNVGTCKLIDAAKQAGVKKVVLVSSILTNGRAWGQEESPGFVATNAFGGALDEKLVAEKHLRASGLDYTIVRPGGLQGKPPKGALSINPEDTLNAGEISRDLVADVCVASLTDPKASNKVLEIIEDEGKPAKVFNGLMM